MLCCVKTLICEQTSHYYIYHCLEIGRKKKWNPLVVMTNTFNDIIVVIISITPYLLPTYWWSAHRHCAITSLYSLKCRRSSQPQCRKRHVRHQRTKFSFQDKQPCLSHDSAKRDSLKPFVITGCWRFNHFLVKLTLARQPLCKMEGISSPLFTECRAHKSRRSRQIYYQLQHHE